MRHQDRFGNEAKIIGPGWVILCPHKYGGTMSASNKGLWQKCLRCKRWIKTIEIEGASAIESVSINEQRT